MLSLLGVGKGSTPKYVPRHVVLVSYGMFNPTTNMHVRMFEVARNYLEGSRSLKVVGGIIAPAPDETIDSDPDRANAEDRCEMADLAIKDNNWIKMDRWASEQNRNTRLPDVLTHFGVMYKAVRPAQLEMYPGPGTTGPGGVSIKGAVYLRPELHVEGLYDFRPPEQDDLTAEPTQERDAADMQEMSIEQLLKIGNEQRAKKAAPPERKRQTSGKEDEDPDIRIMGLCGMEGLIALSRPGLFSESDIIDVVSRGLVVVHPPHSDPDKYIYSSDILYRYKQRIHLITDWNYMEIPSTLIRHMIEHGESIQYIVSDDVIHYIQSKLLYRCPQTPMSPSRLNLPPLREVLTPNIPPGKKKRPNLRLPGAPPVQQGPPLGMALPGAAPSGMAPPVGPPLMAPQPLQMPAPQAAPSQQQARPRKKKPNLRLRL